MALRMASAAAASIAALALALSACGAARSPGTYGKGAGAARNAAIAAERRATVARQRGEKHGVWDTVVDIVRELTGHAAREAPHAINYLQERNEQSPADSGLPSQ